MSVEELALAGMAARVSAWSRTLAAEGFVSLPGVALERCFEAADLSRFGASWQHLDRDDQAGDWVFRLRRYGRLMAARGHARAWDITPLPHTAFRQSAQHIPLYAGQARMFSPVSAETLADPVLAGLIGLDLDIISAAGDVAQQAAPRFEVGLHLIRVVTTAGSPGIPTPEGRHRDGHDYIGMHLLRRAHCSGGESVIYREGGPPARIMLARPLDSLVVADARITHEVTPMTAEDASGERDMLLVDINAC